MLLPLGPWSVNTGTERRGRKEPLIRAGRAPLSTSFAKRFALLGGGDRLSCVAGGAGLRETKSFARHGQQVAELGFEPASLAPGLIFVAASLYHFLFPIRYLSYCSRWSIFFGLYKNVGGESKNPTEEQKLHGM